MPLVRGEESPILALVEELSKAFEAEKNLGFTVDNEQPEESFCRRGPRAVQPCALSLEISCSHGVPAV